jgi:large subunit ribosomal protein L21
MFAVIKTGGKQYKVAKEDILCVEKLGANAGDTVQFNEILMLGNDSDVTVGAPMIDGAAVQAEIVEFTRADKVISFVKRRRKHSSARKRGHRQHLTKIKITDILASGGDKSGVMAAVGAGSVSAAALSAAAPAAKTEKPKAAKKPAAKAAAAPAEAQTESTRPANLLTEAKGEADDLKRISGVGPKLEGLLHDNGVFHFWQIAEWTASEVSYMDDQLSFKGRIDRDDWIKQAAEFAAEAK